MEKQKKRFSSQLKKLGIHLDSSNVTPGDIGICALLDPDFPDVTQNRDPDIPEQMETVEKKKIPKKKTESTPELIKIQNEKVRKSKVKKTKKKLIKLFDQLIDQKTQLKKLTNTSIKIYKEIREEIENKDSDFNVTYVDECAKVDQRIKKVQNDIRDTKNNLDVLMKSHAYNYMRKAIKGDSVIRIPPKRINKSRGKVVFECHYCTFRKPSSGAVETHMVKNHNYAPFECSFCNHTTTSSRSLYIHNVRKHNFNSAN